MNGNPCARAGGAFAYTMGAYRAIERRRLDLMQAEMDRIARGIKPAVTYSEYFTPACPGFVAA